MVEKQGDAYLIECQICGYESGLIFSKKIVREQLKTDFWRKAIRDDEEIDICKFCYSNIKNIKLID